MNLRPHSGGLAIDILVQPRASRVRIGPMVGDRLKVSVTAPPVDGAANAAVVDALSHALGIPRRQVEVVSGDSSRRKTIKFTGVGAAELEGLSR